MSDTAHPPGLLGVPTHPWMWARSVKSLMGLQLPPGSHAQVADSSTTIAQKRNTIAASMLANPDLEWVAYVDADMIVQPDSILRLLDRDQDIVGGLSCSREPKRRLEAGMVQQRGDDPMRPTDGPGVRWSPLTPDDIPGDADGMRVDVIGFGCVVVRRRVFEMMDEPWFLGNEQHGQDADVAEDHNFCLRAGDAGFDVVVDSRGPAGAPGAQSLLGSDRIGYTGGVVPSSETAAAGM